jgi:hypothetical protein
MAELAGKAKKSKTSRLILCRAAGDLACQLGAMMHYKEKTIAQLFFCRRIDKLEERCTRARSENDVQLFFRRKLCRIITLGRRRRAARAFGKGECN